MDELGPSTTVDEAAQAARARPEPGWGDGAAQNIERLGSQAVVGDFVWTRDTHGRYLLGQIIGPYRYDGSEAAKAVDVHQVRDVVWAPRPLNDLEVPGSVIRAFTGTGMSFSRIRDPGSRQMSAFLWARLRGNPLPPLQLTPLDVLTSHLDPYDVEDLVYVWLQVARNFVALPRARQRDTPAYEWSMIHRQSRRRAIVQIKTGQVPVDLGDLHSAKTDDRTDTFAYATCGQYEGSPRPTEIICNSHLLDLVREFPDLLPLRTRMWFELTDLGRQIS